MKCEAPVLYEESLGWNDIHGCEKRDSSLRE